MLLMVGSFMKIRLLFLNLLVVTRGQWYRKPALPYTRTV